jgi:PAS domain S-box-containing protein
MPSVLIGVDILGRVTQWNGEACRVTGVPAEQAMGQLLAETFPWLGEELERVKEAMQTGEVSKDPRRIRTVDGETRYEDVTVYPLIANGVGGAVIRVDDVTERVRIEEIMVQSEKMLSVGGLAAGMAHEINNPLAGIMQAANVMKNRLTSKGIRANLRAAEAAGTSMEAIKAYMAQRDIYKMLDTIRESGKRAAEIVANMLNFSRKSDSSLSTVNLAELLDQTVEMAGSDYNLKKKYDFRQIKIQREYQEDLPLAKCEGVKIQQVFLNILRNGAEAMAEKLKRESQESSAETPCFILRLAHEPETNQIHIEIEDNGPGMNEATRRRVFEPFFTTKPPDRGTGLGLSVSYFIITENHDGEMTVQSTPDQGTKFVINLPVERDSRS